MAHNTCPVHWGSHGCDHLRGHEGLHECDCCECEDHIANEGVYVDEYGEESLCVATWPYYGADTKFYGEDDLVIAP